MAVEKGSAFLLKVGDGGSPVAYATVAGLRTTQLSVNGEAVAITSKDSGAWRELLSGAGVRSVSVSAAMKAANPMVAARQASSRPRRISAPAASREPMAAVPLRRVRSWVGLKLDLPRGGLIPR